MIWPVCREKSVTHATLLPAFCWSRLLRRCRFEHLIVAGEDVYALLSEVARWLEQSRMINAYGPTETTVCATMSESLLSAMTVCTADWSSYLEHAGLCSGRLFGACAVGGCG